MMEMSLIRRITQVYSFIKSNDLMLPDIEKMTQSQLETFFNKFKDNYIFDNRQTFDMLF